MANADSTVCKSSPKDKWLCKGDPAPHNGYLLDEQTLLEVRHRDLLMTRIMEEREAYKGLADRMQLMRSEFEFRYAELMKLYDASKSIRTDALDQRDKALSELVLVEDKYAAETQRRFTAELKLSSSYEPWEVGAIAGGASLGALLIGIGIGALVK